MCEVLFFARAVLQVLVCLQHKSGVISHFRNAKAQCACFMSILSNHALKDSDLEIRQQIKLRGKLESGEDETDSQKRVVDGAIQIKEFLT